MAFLHSLDISGSGLTASRLRMDLISENIANSETTRTGTGGPYRRKMAVYQCADSAGTFRNMLDKKISGTDGQSQTVPNGVKVTAIAEDQTPFSVEYDPTSPDADARGYVREPNGDLIKETTDMMAVTRAYSPNLPSFAAVKNCAAKAL